MGVTRRNFMVSHIDFNRKWNGKFKKKRAHSQNSVADILLSGIDFFIGSNNGIDF